MLSTIYRKVSELWEIMCNKYYFNMSAFVGFIVWNIYLSKEIQDIPEYYYMTTKIT